MELLDVVDENGLPTGAVVPREKAHAEGIRHRTSHVWLVRMRAGKLEILLQKRCRTKDSWPGCYDISSAGHIPAGVDFIPSALRELREELGVEAGPEELIFCGDRQICSDSVFLRTPFPGPAVFPGVCSVAGSGGRGIPDSKGGNRLGALDGAGSLSEGSEAECHCSLHLSGGTGNGQSRPDEIKK